jgi:cytochrome P450
VTDAPAEDRRRPVRTGSAQSISHQRPGQNIARAELRTILPEQLRRFPDMRLAVQPEQVPMDVHDTNQGVRKLLVTW